MKRHFLVDVLGLLICIVVHAVDIGERAGAKLVLEKMDRQRLPRLKKVLADGGYTGDKMSVEASKYGVDWEVVERSIFWTMNWRSLCRQYDNDSQTTEANIYLTSIYYMTKRITKTD